MVERCEQQQLDQVGFVKAAYNGSISSSAEVSRRNPNASAGLMIVSVRIPDMTVFPKTVHTIAGYRQVANTGALSGYGSRLRPAR